MSWNRETCQFFIENIVVGGGGGGGGGGCRNANAKPTQSRNQRKCETCHTLFRPAIRIVSHPQAGQRYRCGHRFRQVSYLRWFRDCVGFAFAFLQGGGGGAEIAGQVEDTEN